MKYKQFLTGLGISEHQICTYDISIMDEKYIDFQRDIFFLGNMKQTFSKNMRAKKTDMENKTYFAIDFDIRENKKAIDGTILSDDDLFDGLVYIKDTLESIKMGDRKYIVFSGNGFHFYYTGKPCVELDLYEYAVQKMYSIVNENIDQLFACDTSCYNVSRIMRLPGSTNTKRKIKHGLEYRKCEVIETQDKNFDMFFDNIIAIGQKEKDRKDSEKQAKQEEIRERMKQRQSLYNGDKSVFDNIVQIDILPIVSDYLHLDIAKDGKNFISDKDNKYIGCYVTDNILINTGSSRIDNSCRGYNTFSFVKTHFGLNNADTYKWFCDKYIQIDELDKKQKQDYVENKNKQEAQKNKTVIDNAIDHIVTFGELINTAIENKASRDIKKLCSYGHPELDKHLCGILEEDLVVIGAETGVGKSEIAFNIAIENARKGKKVFLFALEGSLEDIMHRYIWKQLAKKHRIEPKLFVYDGSYMIDEYKQETERINSTIANNLLIFDKKTIANKDFICDMIRKLKNDVDLFVLDHLHYIELTTTEEHKETGEIMKELKTVNEEIRKPIVVVSHMRKKIGKRMKNEKPTENDLHGTSNIAKIATVIMLLYRLDGMGDYNTGFYVPKNRYIGGNISLYATYDITKKDYIGEFVQERDIRKDKVENKMDDILF